MPGLEFLNNPLAAVFPLPHHSIWNFHTCGQGDPPSSSDRRSTGKGSPLQFAAMKRRFLVALLIASLVWACKGRKDLHVATTTSVEASGLLDRIVPAFEKHIGLHLRVVAVGTGQAL